MIITCEKCTKKFKIEDDLIPNEGRYLQCGSCDYKWFFKKTNDDVKLDNKILNKKELKIEKTALYNNLRKTDKTIVNNEQIGQNLTKNISNKKRSNPKILKNSIVLIITVIALIILLDTFKNQLSNFIPGLNSILNNLYESLKDLSLFFKDLVN